MFKKAAIIVCGFTVVAVHLLANFLLASSIVNAQSKPVFPNDGSQLLKPSDEARLKNTELTNAFINYCLSDDSRGPSFITTSQFDNGEFFGNGNNTEVRISDWIDDSNGSNNNKRTCKNLTQAVTTALYGSKRAYINNFYDEVKEGGVVVGYQLKDKYCNEEGSGDTGCIGYSYGTLRTDIRNKAVEKNMFRRNGNQIEPIVYAYYEYEVLHPFVAACFTKTNTDNQTGDVDIQGVRYTYKDGEGKKLAVGLLIDSADGEWSCKEFAAKLNTDRWAFILLTEDEVRDQMQEYLDGNTDEDKQRRIQEILDANEDVLKACWARSYLTEAQRNDPAVLDAMWNLLNLDGGGPPWASWLAGIETPSDPKMQDVLDCVTAFLPEITEIVEETPPDVDPPTPPEGGEEDKGDDCYDSVEPLFTIPITNIKVPNPLKWAVCGISQLLAGLIDNATEAVYSMLKTDPTEDAGQGDLKAVWSSLVRIANYIFIISFLIVVISTALDMGIFSNYTVKKLLPRIIVAALLANLSWEICSVLFEITNAVGDATKSIILSPLTGTPENESVGQAASKLFTDNYGAVTVGLGALIYAAIASGGAILLPVMATVTIAVIIALVVLSLRKIFLILLVLAAPLALASMALPGGDKLARRWWKLFTQLLLMYPMIAALFAGGIFVSSILEPTSNNLLDSAIQIVVLFLPFFMLPVVFKAAGGAIANVTGMVNDRGRGLIDRSKNYRDNSSQYGRRKKLKAAGREQRGQQELFESLQGDGKKAQYRRHQAFGMKGLGSKNRARADSVRNSMLGQTEEAVHKQQVQGLAEQVRGMDVTAAKSELSKIAMNMDQDGTAGSEGTGNYSDAQRAAAISLMTQYKDVNGLEKVQKQMLKEGKSGKPNSLKTWNDAMGKNFSEMKAISPHLATDVTASDTNATMEAKYAQAFLGATEQNKASMKVEGWQKFNQVAPAASQASAASVLSNDVLKGSMPSDAASYFNTSSEQATATLAGSAVGQTVLSVKPGEDKVTPWLNATGGSRSYHELKAAHAGLEAKINGLSPEKRASSEPHLRAAQEVIERHARDRNLPW